MGWERNFFVVSEGLRPYDPPPMVEVPIPKPPGERWTLAASYRYCSDMAGEHYENFPVGSRWIPPRLRPDVHAIYAFARWADDFADETLHRGLRLERLAAWRKNLNEAAMGRAKHPVFIALAHTIARHQVPVEWLDRLIQAFELDVRQSRHETFDSIEEYAKYSANPVGRLVLWLHGYREAELFLLSDDICSALQFANFWQDVAVDLKKNRIYLPKQDMAEAAYSERELFSGVRNRRFRELMRLEVDRTWDLFHRGRGLCDRVGRDLRIELRLVWLGGTRILERIESVDYDVFQFRPTLKWKDKGLMLLRALRWNREAA